MINHFSKLTDFICQYFKTTSPEMCLKNRWREGDAAQLSETLKTELNTIVSNIRNWLTCRTLNYRPNIINKAM